MHIPVEPEDYEALDLSIFSEQARIAVKCESEEEAVHFLAAMKMQHPDKCENWNFPRVNWGEDICYCAGVHPGDKWTRMMRGGESAWEASDYTIIPFSTLVIEELFEESDQSLDLLFGGAFDA